MGVFDDAEIAYKNALSNIANHLGEDSDAYISALRALAVNQRKKGDDAGSIISLLKVKKLALENGIEGDTHISILNSLGYAYMCNGEIEKARTELQIAEKLIDAEGYVLLPSDSAIYRNLGSVALNMDDVALAAVYYDKALSLVLKTEGEGSIRHQNIMKDLAEL